jgi:neutral amino acid transport system permease protein
MIIGSVGTIVAMTIAEYLLWKPMRDRCVTSTTLIVISIGLALFIRNGILSIWEGIIKAINFLLSLLNNF